MNAKNKMLFYLAAIFCISAIVQTAAAEDLPDAKAKEKKPFKGLWEALGEDELRWLPEDFFKTEGEKTISELLITPPAKKKYVDALFEPIFLGRMNYVTTMEETFTTADGKKRSSTELRRTYLGHREGFVLENLEAGFKGRHNETGLYYGVKLEFVPREKDGTKSESDYLKEAWMGWNYYAIIDVKTGRIKLPISRALLKSTHEATLVYSPLLDTLLPKRLLGVSVSLSDPWKIAVLTGGVFNTVKEPYEMMPDAKHLMYAGRLELNADKALDLAGINTGSFFNLSLAGSLAYSEESWDPRSKLRFIGADARLDLNIFTVEGEVLFKDYYGEGTASNIAMRGFGWYVDFCARLWPSVLDFTFRFEEADNDEDLEVGFATDAGVAVNQKKRWLTFGLMLHVTKNLDFEANYINRREAEGVSFKNDVFMTLLQFNI